MSYLLKGDDVTFYQRLLASEGYYTGRLDGIWGPKTAAASAAFDRDAIELRETLGEFDIRTESHIFSLSIAAQRAARHFMNRALGQGERVKIISGTRTYEEQNKLYRQGRYGNPGKIVTKARGGRSNHNFGIAWDVGIFESDGAYCVDEDRYIALAEYAQGHLEWGGDWRRFPDYPHYQLPTVGGVSLVRERFEKGEPYTA